MNKLEINKNLWEVALTQHLAFSWLSCKGLDLPHMPRVIHEANRKSQRLCRVHFKSKFMKYYWQLAKSQHVTTLYHNINGHKWFVARLTRLFSNLLASNLIATLSCFEGHCPRVLKRYCTATVFILYQTMLRHIETPSVAYPSGAGRTTRPRLYFVADHVLEALVIPARRQNTYFLHDLRQDA